MISRNPHIERRRILQERARICTAPIVFYGDSLIHYWEKEGAEAWEKYLAPLGAASFGIEGDCTRNLKERLEDGELDLAQDPVICMLLIGTNNLTTHWGKEPIEDTLLGIREVAEMITARFPLVQLYIQKIFPRGRALKNAVRTKGERVNESMEVWNLPRTQILSHGELFLQEDGKINPLYTTDFIHLTPEGYQRWAQALASLLGDENTEK